MKNYAHLLICSLSVSNPVLHHVYRYSCTDNECSNVNQLNLTDMIGCHTFCTLDANGDGEISLAEREASFLTCTGGDRG